MQSLLQLQDQLNQLLKAFSTLQMENKELQLKLKKQAQELEEKNKMIASLRENLNVNSVHQFIDGLDEKTKEQWKISLDKAIDALDKNIQLLK